MIENDHVIGGDLRRSHEIFHASYTDHQDHSLVRFSILLKTG